MKSGTKLLIVYTFMQLLTAGCATSKPMTYAEWKLQGEIAADTRAATSSALRHIDALNNIGKDSEKPATNCQPFGNGFICN